MWRTLQAWLQARRRQQYLRGYAAGLAQIKNVGRAAAISRFEDDLAQGVCIGHFERGQLVALTA